ncbi:DUF4870 domain-containing protein [Rothia nasimurium]|uniref:DUF4870 domain-containing protein n=1 Tax=Rothia nasimurium TaxID=85336 RepID=UPI003B9FD292
MNEQNQNQAPYGNYNQQGQNGPSNPQQGQPSQQQPGMQGQPQGGQYGYGQQPGFGAPTYDAYGNVIPADAKNMAMFAHLSGLLGLVLTASFANFIGPLIFWAIYKDKPGYGFVRVAAAGAFNFSFTLWLVNIAAWVLTLVTFGIAGLFTWIIFIGVWVALLVMHILAAVKANNGEVFNYPVVIKVLK